MRIIDKERTEKENTGINMGWSPEKYFKDLCPYGEFFITRNLISCSKAWLIPHLPYIYQLNTYIL